MKTNQAYSIKTFGCKVNTYDSALIQKNLNQAEFDLQPKGKPNLGAPEVHIINTCAVTNEAVKEALRYIRRYKAKCPQSRIVVTGCASQVETEKFAHLKEVDLVVANSHKADLANILNPTGFEKGSALGQRTVSTVKMKKDRSNKTSINNKFNNKVFKSSIFKKADLGQGGELESGRTRFFLKIQDGCDSFCTFCIIPFARGKSRSIPVSNLVRSVQDRYNQGVREVVLTGVHIGDYQDPQEGQKGLPQLLSALLAQTKMPRIRLSSLEPIELTPELLDLFSEPRVCAHFHLSIQSAHSEVLKKMKRKYKAEDVEKTLKDINKKIPQAFVGMDLIAGFADESQAQFEDTYLRLKDWPWTKLHVFPYSPRRYTYAQRTYNSYPRSLIMKRASLLRHLSEERFKTNLKAQIGQIKKVLPLTHKESIGLSRDYWTMLLPKKHSVDPTEEVSVPVYSIDEKRGYLIGSAN